MPTIVIKSQSDLDALPERFDQWTIIEIRADTRIVLTKARGNSSVVAWGNSSVEAWGNSSVVARGNSSVVAWGNSSVVAWGNSNVEARGNSSVVAWGNVCVRVYADSATVVLFAFAVAFAMVKAKIQKKSKTSTVITPKIRAGLDGWLENNAIETAETLVLYKRVSKDFLTQEATANQTAWIPGTTVEHPNYRPESGECGAGKFHFCSRAYFCDEFRSKHGDRYVALEVAKADVHAWANPDYPHKIGGRKAKVLYECDRFGKPLVSSQSLKEVE